MTAATDQDPQQRGGPVTGTLYLPRGLPASGKTSWARQLVAEHPVGSVVRMSRDDLRAMALPASYVRPTHEVEKVVAILEHSPIAGLLRSGVDVIVDGTNLRTRFARNLDLIAASVDAPTVVVDDFLAVPVDECVARDKARRDAGGRSVGEAVIREMHDRYLSGGRALPPIVRVDSSGNGIGGMPYTPVPGTPKAIIADIDGTVALHQGRNPYDTARCAEDLPNRPVIEQVRLASAAGHHVLFASGRHRDFEAPTVQWLAEHVITDGMQWELFMRASGDFRNDAVVKLELFDQHIRSRFDVRWVYDDRARVVRMWRSVGLSVMQVAEGNF